MVGYSPRPWHWRKHAISVRRDVLRYVDLLQRVDVVVKHGVRYK